jgi:hypothetical protein
MRWLFEPQLTYSAFGDPGLYVDFRHERRVVTDNFADMWTSAGCNPSPTARSPGADRHSRVTPIRPRPMLSKTNPPRTASPTKSLM